jgi:hypothetical protein
MRLRFGGSDGGSTGCKEDGVLPLTGAPDSWR